LCRALFVYDRGLLFVNFALKYAEKIHMPSAVLIL
jgi:hypothetical protein